jgi:hypothetical protein
LTHNGSMEEMEEVVVVIVRSQRGGDKAKVVASW